MLNWNSLKLVTELQQKNSALHAQLTTVSDYVKPLLGHTRPVGSEEFTDHDFAHSARIAQRIGQFLPDSCALNGTELYILLLAVLLHDSGMWGPKEEVRELPDDPKFREWAERRHETRWKQVQEDLAHPPRLWMGEMGLRHLAAIWFRENHPARLGTFVFDPKSPTGPTLRVLIGDRYLQPVADVAVAHSWEQKRVLEDEALDPHEIGGEPVNLRFLACLLRLGDLLDLGEGRISTLLWSYLRPLSAVSEAHWRKEHTLKVRHCTPDLIEVGGTFDIAAGGLTISEAYRLALEWLDWLESEIKDCARIVHTRVPKDCRSRCELGELRFDRSKVKANGLVTGEKIAFELNRHRILELLGDEIYSSGSVFVRELLQNALDATRAQIVRDHTQQMQDDPVTYPPDRPWNWPHSITGTERYAIDVAVEEVRDERGRDLILFSVTDRGTGMTLEQIQGHFLQVGVSFYQSDKFRNEFRFRPISRFGIGFLSCLTVAQPDCRIEVKTRAAGEHAGLCLSIQMPSDQYLITTDDSLAQGTTVKVWIDPTASHPPGWDNPPMTNGEFNTLFGSSMPEDMANASLIRLAMAAQTWVVFPEVLLRINDQAWGPRKVETGPEAGKAVLGSGGLNFAARLPLNFFSPSGRPLGQGIFFQRGFKSELPMETNLSYWNFMSFQSHRSIYLTGDVWSGLSTFFLLWNSIRLPARSLSAARLLRGGESPLNSAVFAWWLRWMAYLHEELEKRSLELASLWRLLLHGDEGEELPVSLPSRRYPVRRDGRLEWLTRAEIEDLGPVLLVPYGIAWHATPSAPLPIVGRARIHDDNFDTDGCRLVEVEGHCTALLWPPDAKAEGLKWFTDGVTFVYDGDAMGSATDTAEKSKPLTLNDLVSFPAHTYDREKLPSYDRAHNPWRIYRLKIDTLPDLGFEEDDSETGRRANELLHATPPIPIPPELLRVVVPDGDTWE